MKKFVGSFLSLNRRGILVLSVVLCMAVFGVIVVASGVVSTMTSSVLEFFGGSSPSSTERSVAGYDNRAANASDSGIALREQASAKPDVFVEAQVESSAPFMKALRPQKQQPNDDLIAKVTLGDGLRNVTSQPVFGQTEDQESLVLSEMAADTDEDGDRAKPTRSSAGVPTRAVQGDNTKQTGDATSTQRRDGDGRVVDG